VSEAETFMSRTSPDNPDGTTGRREHMSMPSTPAAI
jgi:hypothetical protein